MAALASVGVNVILTSQVRLGSFGSFGVRLVYCWPSHIG